MCAPSDFDPVVDVEPFWMVIDCFCLGSNFGHKLEEALVKIGKRKFLLDGISLLNKRPPVTQKGL